MKNNFYKILVFTGIVIWLSETAYFGWNDDALTAPEKILDTISWVMIAWGIIGDITTNLTIKKHTTNNVKTRNVNINGKPVIKFRK